MCQFHQYHILCKNKRNKIVIFVAYMLCCAHSNSPDASQGQGTPCPCPCLSAAELDKAQDELYHIPDSNCRYPCKGYVNHQPKRHKVVYHTQVGRKLRESAAEPIGHGERGKYQSNTVNQKVHKAIQAVDDGCE